MAGAASGDRLGEVPMLPDVKLKPREMQSVEASRYASTDAVPLMPHISCVLHDASSCYLSARACSIYGAAVAVIMSEMTDRFSPLR